MAVNRNISCDGSTTAVYLTVEPDACDLTGAWRPDAALTAMQLASHYGREALGIGWSALAERGALWVVSRINLSLSRIPRLGEKLTVRATALPAVKLLFPWKFLITDAAGEIIGEGSAIWNLMDASARRITYIPGIGDRIPKSEGTSPRPELPGAAAELSCPPERRAVRPVYSDLDINGHVSNIRYLTWCCNALGADVLRRFAISSLRISFMQEVLPEAVVDTELRTENDRFSFSGYNGESPAFIIEGTLTKREPARSAADLLDICKVN